MAKGPEPIVDFLLDFLVDDDPVSEHLADMLTLIIGRPPLFDDTARIENAPKDDALIADCVITSVVDIVHC
jgi:hypothetical protein